MQQLLEKKLQDSLQPDTLEIVNESHKHSGAANRESHFKALIVSAAFTNSSKMARHRMIFSLLSDEMKSIHALSLALFTPDEWQAKENHTHTTPMCAKNVRRQQDSQ